MSQRCASVFFRTVGAALGVLVSMTQLSYAQLRLEMRAIQTETLSAQQFLTGSGNGKPAELAGELRIPKPGTDKFPAVILIHGSGGIDARHARWVDELNSAGIATFLVDSFSGRGIVNTITDQSQLEALAMMVDAYRALALVAQHPRIDAGRIAVMGFSKGAVGAVYSSNERFRKMYGPSNVEFAAHIGMCTPCYTTYRDDDKVSSKPIRLFHGQADDWVPIQPCRDYVERLKKAGADVALTEYPGAAHAYDAFVLKEPLKLPQAQTPRNCRLAEGESGQILNSKTGAPFTLSDPCMEKGTTIAYDEAATAATVKAVKDLLTALPAMAMKN
jgi:dienelactone hydrolase